MTRNYRTHFKLFHSLVAAAFLAAACGGAAFYALRTFEAPGPLTAARATATLTQFVARQASLLAYIDVFYVFGVFTACTLPLVLLLRTRRTEKESLR